MAGGAVALTASASGTVDRRHASIFTKIPAGYRHWKLISVAHEEANLTSFAAGLGNDVAIKVYRDGQLPFPDVRSSLVCTPLRAIRGNNRSFGQAWSFIAGDSTSVQFMVKDSRTSASTGEWEFGHFNQDGTHLPARRGSRSARPVTRRVRAILYSRCSR